MPIPSEQFNNSIDEHQRLVDLISEHYRKKEHSIHQSVKMGRFLADVIAVRDENQIIAIEVKKDDISEVRKGVGQALSYKEWAHKVYLAVPQRHIQLCHTLLQHTPIGILSEVDDRVMVAKEADHIEPDKTKSNQLLYKTTGFCWMCGKSLNTVPPTDSEVIRNVLIGFRHDEPDFIKKLERIMGKKVQTINYWVSICKVCSRIMGEAMYSFLMAVLDEVEPDVFDFGIADYQREELLNKMLLLHSEQQTSTKNKS